MGWTNRSHGNGSSNSGHAPPAALPKNPRIVPTPKNFNGPRMRINLAPGNAGNTPAHPAKVLLFACISEYFRTEKEYTISMDGSYYRADFKPYGRNLIDDAKKLARIRKARIAEKEGNMHKPLEELTEAEVKNGLQRVLFWTLQRACSEGGFSNYPHGACINLSPLGEEYAAPLRDMKRLGRDYLGSSSYSRIRLYIDGAAMPGFAASMDEKGLSLFIRRGMDLETMLIMLSPFVKNRRIRFKIALSIAKATETDSAAKNQKL